MPCGIRLLVSKPNQLTPVNRTTLPAESTIFDPEVDQNPSPGAAAAGREAVSKIAAASKHGAAAHISRRFMILSREWWQGLGGCVDLRVWCPECAGVQDLRELRNSPCTRSSGVQTIMLSPNHAHLA